MPPAVSTVLVWPAGPAVLPRSRSSPRWRPRGLMDTVGLILRGLPASCSPPIPGPGRRQLVPQVGPFALAQRRTHLGPRRLGGFGRGGGQGLGRLSGRKRVVPLDPGGVPYRRGSGGRNMAAVTGPVTEKVSDETGLC